MKSLIIIFSLLISGLLFFAGFTNYATVSSLSGRYINNNTEHVIEGPKPVSQGIDTLILKNDNTFESQTWGAGNYVVKPSIFGTRIELIYGDETGKAGYEMLVTSPLSGKVRL